MRYFIINENMEKLAKDKKLRPIELMVMANIYSFHKSNIDCKESMKSFADRFGVTYPTIMKCFDNLVNKNIIVKGEKLDRNNNIWLLSDETIKAIDETPTENKQESKQDNKQDELKEENTVNTTPNKEITIEKAIDVIEDKEDYPICKDLIIKYIIYMYEKHNKTFTVSEIEDLYNDSQILSEKELEKAINTVITKGYKAIKFDCFKQERKKNKFDNFEQRQYKRTDFYKLESNFFN